MNGLRENVIDFNPALAGVVQAEPADDDAGADYLLRAESDEGLAAVQWAEQRLGVAAPESGEDVSARAKSHAGLAAVGKAMPQYPAETQGQFAPGAGAEGMREAGRTVAELPGAVAHGGIKGINEFIKTASELSDWAAEHWGPTWKNGREHLGWSPEDSDTLLDGPLSTIRFPYRDIDEPPLQLPNLSEPETGVGKAVSAVSEFLTGFIPAGRVLQTAGWAAKTGGRGVGMLRGMTRGGLADFAFMDPADERVSNLIQAVPELANPLTEFLAQQPGDTSLDGRFKNFVEGLGLGVLGEGLFKGMQVLRSAKWARKGNSPEDLSHALRQAEEEAAARQAGLRSLGDPEAPLLRPVSAEIETLERAGFAVDREVFGAPIVPDNKRRYGITRRALEAEGVFGDRWTSVETAGREWPEMPKNRTLRGKLADAWRKAGRVVYDRVKGEYTVSATGEQMLVGSKGKAHVFGQSQTPEAIKALPYLPELIQKALKTGEYNPKPSTASAQDLRPTTIYHSAASIDGAPYDMTLVAKRNPGGKQELIFYDMRAKGKGLKVPEVPRASGDAPPFTPTDPKKALGLSDIKVADFFADVKDIVDDAGQSAQPGPLGGRGGQQLTAVSLLNFARIDSPEDVRSALRSLDDDGRENPAEARLTEPASQDPAFSAALEEAWQDLSGRGAGEAAGAGQNPAARRLWAASGQKLAELAELVERAASAPSAENLFAFRKMLEIHRAVRNEIAGARPETASALGLWRIPVGPSAAKSRQMAETLDGAGGLAASRDLAFRVAGLSRAGLMRELETLVDKIPARLSLESIGEAWAATLLSGPEARPANALGTTLTALHQVFGRGASGRIGRALDGENGVQLGEGLARLRGLVEGAKDGLRLARKSFRAGEGGAAGQTGLPPEPAVSAESLRLSRDSLLGKVVDVAGSALRRPGRALMGEDEFFKSVGYRAELHAQAYRQAVREASAGLAGQDGINARIAEIIENPPSNIRRAAVDPAVYAAYTDAPGTVAQSLLRLSRQAPELRFILPFIQTPAKILNYAVPQRSPLAPLFRSFREDAAAGGARRQLALARVSAGAALHLAVADLAFSGLITAGGPANPAERRALLRTGWRPYSLKIDGRYHAYNRLAPLGASLGLSADLAEISSHLDHEDPEADMEEAAIFLAAALANSAMSKNCLSGLADAIDALAEPGRRAEELVRRLAGPAANAPRHPHDPYLLEVNNLAAAMRTRTPGLSEKAEARRDLWGRPIGYRNGLSVLDDAVSPIASRRENPEPVDREMLRLDAYVPAVKRKTDFDGLVVDLARFPGAYSRYAELAGNAAGHPAYGPGCLDVLNAVVTGKHYMSQIYRARSDGPAGGKAEFIRSMVQQYRNIAKQQLLREFPELRRYLDQKRAAVPPGSGGMGAAAGE